MSEVDKPAKSLFNNVLSNFTRFTHSKSLEELQAPLFEKSDNQSFSSGRPSVIHSIHDQADVESRIPVGFPTQIKLLRGVALLDMILSFISLTTASSTSFDKPSLFFSLLFSILASSFVLLYCLPLKKFIVNISIVLWILSVILLFPQIYVLNSRTIILHLSILLVHIVTLSFAFWAVKSMKPKVENLAMITYFALGRFDWHCRYFRLFAVVNFYLSIVFMAVIVQASLLANVSYKLSLGEFAAFCGSLFIVLFYFSLLNIWCIIFVLFQVFSIAISIVTDFHVFSYSNTTLLRGQTPFIISFFHFFASVFRLFVILFWFFYVIKNMPYDSDSQSMKSSLSSWVQPDDNTNRRSSQYIIPFPIMWEMLIGICWIGWVFCFITSWLNFFGPWAINNSTSLYSYLTDFSHSKCPTASIIIFSFNIFAVASILCSFFTLLLFKLPLTIYLNIFHSVVFLLSAIIYSQTCGSGFKKSDIHYSLCFYNTCCCVPIGFISCIILLVHVINEEKEKKIITQQEEEEED